MVDRVGSFTGNSMSTLRTGPTEGLSWCVLSKQSFQNSKKKRRQVCRSLENAPTLSIGHAVEEDPRRLSVRPGLYKSNVVARLDADDGKQLHFFAQWFQIGDAGWVSIRVMAFGWRRHKPLVIGILRQEDWLVAATFVAAVALKAATTIHWLPNLFIYANHRYSC